MEKPGRPLTVEANMGLVRREAWKFRWALGTVLEEGDLIQAGVIGLMRALETYDAELGALSTYASPWIRVSIQECINHGRRVIRLPPKRESELCRKGSPPPLDVLQLDAPLWHSQGNEEGLSWRDVLRGDDDPTAQLDEVQRSIIMHEALDRLPGRIRSMVRKRFFEGQTLREIAEAHDLSRERVRQLVLRGVRAMRTYMEAVEMGSMKRKVKKSAARHLRLIKGGKSAKVGHGVLAEEFATKEGLEHLGKLSAAELVEMYPAKSDVIGPEAYAKLADELGVDISKPTLGGCTEAREEYELGTVACCPRCHAKNQSSYVEDPAGYYEVCCTVRKHLCPNESGPDHSAA